ncbi:hypothetical protein ONZ45_g14263 [Pleurotus djamor]|nr:hypothetical protein ONZ45_g14263 [Pleurotus djamor]
MTPLEATVTAVVERIDHLADQVMSPVAEIPGSLAKYRAAAERQEATGRKLKEASAVKEEIGNILTTLPIRPFLTLLGEAAEKLLTWERNSVEVLATSVQYTEGIP